MTETRGTAARRSPVTSVRDTRSAGRSKIAPPLTVSLGAWFHSPYFDQNTDYDGGVAAQTVWTLAEMGRRLCPGDGGAAEHPLAGSGRRPGRAGRIGTRSALFPAHRPQLLEGRGLVVDPRADHVRR